MDNRLPYAVITVDCESTVDSESFHSVFSEAFGFPGFYGRNMNAWIGKTTSGQCCVHRMVGEGRAGVRSTAGCGARAAGRDSDSHR